MEERGLGKIEMKPIGFVSRISPDEDERDKSLVARSVPSGISPPVLPTDALSE
jgi:hypothetical protein